MVCDYFTKYTEAYPLADKTARSVADALMDIWLPRYGFPLFLHSDQGKEFDNSHGAQTFRITGNSKNENDPIPSAQRRIGRTIQQDPARNVSHVRVART